MKLQLARPTTSQGSLICIHWIRGCDVDYAFIVELARDALNKTGLFDVIAGIISPVNDAYEKEVSV